MYMYDISAKSNYQFEKPFVWLLRRLVNDANLVLTEAPVLAPTDVVIDQEQVAAMENELVDAANQPLPAEEEDDF